jgi:predicted GNAT family acetyltransferase
MVRIHPNKDEFLQLFLHQLETDEITNTLMIGLSQREHKEPPFFVSSVKKEEYLLGLIAGKNMILASNNLNPTIYHDLVVFMEEYDYPGIIGPKKCCELYNSIYQDITGTRMNVTMDQRIYACYETTGCSSDIGLFREARMDDIEQLTVWAYDFELMIERTADMDHIREMVETKIKQQSLYVIEVDGSTVSMAQRSRRLQNTETVSLVYTPLELRGRGYASRVVELVTNLILKDGKVAALYTDLSNPTSNSIYMKIGYKPHCDSVMMEKDNNH